MRAFFLGWLGLLATLCAGLAAYDQLSFQPALARIRLLVAQHPAGDRSPPPLFAQLLIFATHGDTVPYTTRTVMVLGDPEDSAKPTWAWEIRYAMWGLLVAVHMPEPERVATIASLGFRAEPEPGLTNVAHRHFGEAPAQLSSQQLAMLATLLILGRTSLSEAQLADHASHLLDDFDRCDPSLRRTPGSSALPSGGEKKKPAACGLFQTTQW